MNKESKINHNRGRGGFVRTRKKQRIIIGTLCAIVMGLAVGYAVLSQTLNIQGIGNISGHFEILFTKIEEGKMNESTTIDKQITNTTTATFTIDLKKPSSSGEYFITVENRGMIDAYVESIQGLDEANSTEPTDITFSLEGIELNDKLGAKQSKVFKVKVNWDSNATSIPETSKNLTLTINFVQDPNDNPSEIVSDIEEPVIKDGLIPVTYDENGNTVKADIYGDWYNYENKQWANAVSVTSNSRNEYLIARAGTPVEESDILAYYVWIPRYRYQLWNVDGFSNEQEIQVEFETITTEKSIGDQNGEWLTHPAFTFGDEEISGFWFGKFEMTGTKENPTIKPNQKSLTNLNNKDMFDSIKSMNSETYGLSMYDSHMIKNTEWGAVAYLTNSKYGKCTNGTCEEVWINNVNTDIGETENDNYWGPSITGCSGVSKAAEIKNNMIACESGRDYKQEGVKASTTGNIYGIYDMSGGSWEKTMASIANIDGSFISASSGFTEQPDAKYYDLYPTTTGYLDFSQGKLGDATKETRTNLDSEKNGWYEDFGYFPQSISSSSWFYRGGYAVHETDAGLYNISRLDGGMDTENSSRAVLVT